MPTISTIQSFAVAYPFLGRFKFFQSPPGRPNGRRTVVVRLTTDDGAVGWGQAVPSPRWSYETPESVRSTLDFYLGPALIGIDIDDAAEMRRRLNSEIAAGFSVGQPIAKAAIDLALWDLWGRRDGKSVAQLAGSSAAPEAITLSWTLNPQRLEEIEVAVAEAHARGYRHFNLKVAPDPEFDLSAVRLLRQFAPAAILWVDANGGYDLESALSVAPKFAGLGVSALEQPLAANQLAGYRRLRTQGALPILMDESIVSAADFDEFHQLGLLDGVAVKVSRMGGITESLRLIKRLQETDSLFYASGLTDPDLSLAASLQVFAAGGLRLPAALNGPQFLRGSILRDPPRTTGDQILAPDRPGLGVDVDPERLAGLMEAPDRASLRAD